MCAGCNPYVCGPGAPWRPGPDFSYFDTTGLTDDEIKNIVVDNIRSDPAIPRSDKESVKVEVSGGIVNLTGVVRERRTKPLAYADAFWSWGVSDVNSDIKIQTPQGKLEEE